MTLLGHFPLQSIASSTAFSVLWDPIPHHFCCIIIGLASYIGDGSEMPLFGGGCDAINSGGVKVQSWSAHLSWSHIHTTWREVWLRNLIAPLAVLLVTLSPLPESGQVVMSQSHKTPFRPIQLFCVCAFLAYHKWVMVPDYQWCGAHMCCPYMEQAALWWCPSNNNWMWNMCYVRCRPLNIPLCMDANGSTCIHVMNDGLCCACEHTI